jgi:mannose-P-dolichol utilization defect protein 1
LQGLGFGIIAFACIVKLPQILKIAKSRSASGLSMLSFELEQLALTVHATYGFILGLPFSAYGEAVVLILQNTLLLSQIYSFAKAPLWRPLLVTSIFGAVLSCVSAGTCPPPNISCSWQICSSSGKHYPAQ